MSADLCVGHCQVGIGLQANKQNGHKADKQNGHTPEHKAEAAPKKEEVHVGSSIGMSGRNPLDLIKTDAPLLSEAKTSKAKRALAPLLDAAGRDEACVWYRASTSTPSFCSCHCMLVSRPKDCICLACSVRHDMLSSGPVLSGKETGSRGTVGDELPMQPHELQDLAQWMRGSCKLMQAPQADK